MRSDLCEKCHASLRSCKMCEFYDQTAYNECREPQAERMLEKEKANYCDYYVLRGGDSGNKAEEAFSAADALFKK